MSMLLGVNSLNSIETLHSMVQVLKFTLPSLPPLPTSALQCVTIEILLDHLASSSTVDVADHPYFPCPDPTMAFTVVDNLIRTRINKKQVNTNVVLVS